MSAKENLRKIHSAPEVVLSNAYGTAIIKGQTVGQVGFPTGQIVLADPTRRFGIEDFKRKAFAISVQPGNYPVVVYHAHSKDYRTLAFAEIKFSDEVPVTFSVAKTMIDAENKRHGHCGYYVNDNTTGFMDAKVFQANCDTPRFSGGILSGFCEGLENGNSCAIGRSKNGELSAALFKVTSGYYYWYWGKDRAGKVCTITADFFTYV